MNVKKPLKILSLILTLLLIVALIPLGFVLLSDPNDFKPQLEQLAREQGIELHIDGELNWRLYPDIELGVSDLRLEGEQLGTFVNAAVGMADLQIELKPLLSGQLKIRGIQVSDTELALRELGSISAQNSTAEGSNDRSSSASVQQLVLQNLKLSYKALDGQLIAMNIDELQIQQLNLEGDRFPISLNLSYQDNEQDFALSAQVLVSVDLPAKRYSISTEQFQMDVAGAWPFTILADMDAVVNLQSKQWNLALANAQIDDLLVKANISGGLEPLSAAGQIDVHSSPLIYQQLGRNPIEAQARFDYAAERLLVNELAANLNNTNIQGSVQYYFDGVRQSEVELQVDRLNLDAYLGLNLAPYLKTEPDTDEQGDASSENPLQFLDQAQPTSLRLSIGELLVKQQWITDIELAAEIVTSKAHVKLASARIAGGSIQGSVLARSSGQPQLSISDVSINHLDLSELLVNKAGRPFITGVVDATFRGQIGTLNTGSVFEQLDGVGQLDISNLSLMGTNIEQSICLSAQQLGATAALTNQWPAGTKFEQVSSPFSIDQGILSLNQIGTGFGNIKIAGNTHLDLNSMNMDARLSLRVEGERTSEQGCSINQYLRNTSLPLSCKGNLSENGSTSCGLDSSVVKELLKGQIKNELSRQLNRLLGSDENESEQPEDPVKDAVKGLLEGLLR